VTDQEQTGTRIAQAELARAEYDGESVAVQHERDDGERAGGQKPRVLEPPFVRPRVGRRYTW